MLYINHIYAREKQEQSGPPLTIVPTLLFSAAFRISPMEPAACTNNQSNGNYGEDIIGWFEDVTEKAGLVQTQTLRKILEQNCSVEYLRQWLGDIKIQEVDGFVLESLYTSLVPLASHADLEPYIHRIANGDTGPILTQQPMTTLSLR